MMADPRWNWGDVLKVDVPEGRAGDWAVRRFSVSGDEAFIMALRDACNSQRPGRAPDAGKFTKLVHCQRGIVMSDTQAEWRDHIEPIRLAQGHCLVNGLGLGMVANAMLSKSNVERVTVVEQSADVIALVAPHYTAKYGDRFQVIEADAFEHQPPVGERYSVVWHDIWDTICTDNYPEMKRLHRKYGRRSDWQGSWARELCTDRTRTRKRIR